MSKMELTYGSELRIIVCVIAGVVAALLYHERVKEDAGIGSEADGASEVGGVADGNADGFVGNRHGAEFNGVVEPLAANATTNDTNHAVGRSRDEVAKDTDGDTNNDFGSHKAE